MILSVCNARAAGKGEWELSYTFSPWCCEPSTKGQLPAMWIPAALQHTSGEVAATSPDTLLSASCNVKSLETGQRSQISSLQASRFMTDDNSFQLSLTWLAPKYFSEKWRPNPVNHAHKPSSPLPFALFGKYACIIFILHKLVYIDQQQLLNMHLYMLRAPQVQRKLCYET